MKRLKRLSTSSAALLGLGVLALGVLTATTLSALAEHNVYPPGWNKPDPNVPTPLFDFRSGWGWDDYQRYWPDQTTRGASPKSRPIETGPIIYSMTPGGHRYHQAQ
jgi:hypothetical protein